MDWKRYLRRLLSQGRRPLLDPYASAFDNDYLSEQVLETARRIRGADRPPALIIHGVMPRSGTVYVGELLRLHPDISAYPNDVWEAPLLELAGEVQQLQQQFLQRYRHNIGRFGDRDFLTLMGSAFIAYLHSFVPDGKRMLLKVPDVRHLARFPLMFPYEDLLTLLRDGRDVVSSTLKTWPERDFTEASTRWRNSARLILEFDRQQRAQIDRRYWLTKYEEALEQPESFVREACRRYGLDPQRYPFERIAELPARGASSLQQSGRVHWDPVAAPQGFRPTAHWKAWSARQKKRFKRIAGNALIDAGYCQDLDW